MIFRLPPLRFILPGLVSLVPLAWTQAQEAEKTDPFEKSGNSEPVFEAMTPEREAEILKDVKVVEGFDVTVFAAPPLVNYPVYVAAAPDGTLFVSSDGNGSLGRDPDRGRVIRLRDLDGDQRADETKVFCQVDSPRGLVWDHDRLYLVHPPHLSVFIDHDGDGVSDEQKILVRDIAFGFKDRPADHTTNGLSLGADGWLYIAGGDFGFRRAEGADGRVVQHRGGGVIRVRPDGTGLEVFNTGTRNILEVAVSPRLDLFARDNTNDGGGWNVRFHHLVGLADYGYPRLYKNFADECVVPIADYGGGSGCGATYVDEPGFGDWNDAPFTADWGTNGIYHHALQPRGETFEETRAPEAFVRMTRPTDADVDAMSRFYAASWKGATFRWEGSDVGYIVCVTPAGYEPDPLPNYQELSEESLVRQLSFETNASHRRRLEAVRELERRGKPAFKAHYRPQLESARTPERNALDTFYRVSVSEDGEGLDRVIEAALSETGLTQHTAIRSLGQRGAHEEILARLDSSSGAARGLCRALALIHTSETVSGVIARLPETTDSQRRRALLSCLCRLYHHEGEWKGNSWGTRPDTRGPYYQPEAWSETERIAETLKEVLAAASPDEAAFLVKEMARNRIQSDAALQRLLDLAEKREEVIPEALAQLAAADHVPVSAVPLLRRVIDEDSSDTKAAHLSLAVVALSRTDGIESCQSSLKGLARLSDRVGELEAAVNQPRASDDPHEAKHEAKKMKTLLGETQRDLMKAARALLGSPRLENHHLYLEEQAGQLGSAESVWADAALLKLSYRKDGSPESRELSQKAIESGWQDPKRRRQILEAAARAREKAFAPKIFAALDDSDPEIQELARGVAKRMRLKLPEKDDSPKVGSLSIEEAITAVMDREGDRALGEQIFARATCNACHTVSMEEKQKGPYLGNIAQTYQRKALAESILEPNKTIAQGFATELFTLQDDSQQLGFVTLEGAEEVTFRDITAQVHTVKVGEIKARQKLPQSLMPPGLMHTFTVHEFASLLGYLQGLAEE